MSRAVIVVRTANRPEILNRCIEATVVDGCSVARDAFWLLLDDSTPECAAVNREVTQLWKRSGLRLTYVDRTLAEEIADSIPGATFRSSFRHLVARGSSSPTESGRNLALVTGFSLDPEVLFLVDDDMVVRHEENCFFHWCVNIQCSGSFIVAPRKRGISDMTYLRRLATVLSRDDWTRFVSDSGLSADSGSWYSPTNPLWKRGDNTSDVAIPSTSKGEVLNGQLMALVGTGAEWVPFPSEYNADLNWSFLQSSFYGTPLLKVSGMSARHLPPSIGHSKAQVILSELVGTAITRALRQIKPRGERLMSILDDRLSDILRVELRKELFPFLEAERAIHFRMTTCAKDTPAHRALSQIAATLVDAAQQLRSVDPCRLASEWLKDIADRHRMFLALRRSETVQLHVRRMLFDATV